MKNFRCNYHKYLVYLKEIEKEEFNHQNVQRKLDHKAKVEF